MRTRNIAVSLLSAAAAGTLLLASPASAAVSPPSGGSWDHIWTTTDAANGGTVYVAEYGDIITLCDTAADGKSPIISVDSGADSTGPWSYRYTLSATGGNGTCVTKAASDGGVYDLPENKYIYIGISLSDGSSNSGGTDYWYLNDN